MPDLSERIEDAANEPVSASVDGQSATDRPIGDLIAADQYLAAKTAGETGSGWKRVKRTTAVPPGAV